MFCLVVKQLDEETHDSFKSRNWTAHDAKLSTESTLGAVTWCSKEMHVCIWHSTEPQGLYMVFYRDVSVGLWLTTLCGNAYADGVQSVSSCRLLKD